MSDIALPVIGAEPWGEDLNAYLASLDAKVMGSQSAVTVLESRVDGLSTQVTTLTGQVTTQAGQINGLTSQCTTLAARATVLEGQVSTLMSRVAALEARPDYIFGQATYMFTNLAPPATGNQIRLNNTTPNLVTVLDVRRLDADSADRSQAITMVTPGTLIRLADYDNAANFYRYRATATATKVGADNFTVPVVWHSGAGTIPNSKIAVTMLIVVPPQ